MALGDPVLPARDGRGQVHVGLQALEEVVGSSLKLSTLVGQHTPGGSCPSQPEAPEGPRDRLRPLVLDQNRVVVPRGCIDHWQRRVPLARAVMDSHQVDADLFAELRRRVPLSRAACTSRTMGKSTCGRPQWLPATLDRVGESRPMPSGLDDRRSCALDEQPPLAVVLGKRHFCILHPYINVSPRRSSRGSSCVCLPDSSGYGTCSSSSMPSHVTP